MNTALTTRLNRDEASVGTAALALLISLNTSWYGFAPLATTGTTYSAKETLHWLTLIVALGCAATLAVLVARRSEAARRYLADSYQWIFGFAVVGALAVLGRIVAPPDGDFTIRYGAVLSLVAAVALAYCALRATRSPATPRTTLTTEHQVELGEAFAYIVGAGLLAVTAIFGASLVKHQFSPKADVCNTYAGQYAQQQDTSVLAHCGLDTIAVQLAQVVQGAGIVGLVGVAAMVVVALVPATRS